MVSAKNSFSRLGKWQMAAGLMLLLLPMLFSFELVTAAPVQLAPATLKDAAFLGRVVGQNVIEGPVVALKLRDLAGAEQFVAQVNNSASPLYQQYLTPEQFGLRFGPDEAATSQVKAFLESEGFQVERSGLLLSLKAEAAIFERAFKVQLNTYNANIGGEIQEFFSADRQALVAEALKPYVQAVQLHNRPLRRQAITSPVLNQATPGTPPRGLGPNQIRKAYNLQPLIDAGTQGKGQGLGLVQLTTYSQNDIAVYAQQFGISGYKIEDIVVNGNRLDSRGAGEAALDIEIAIAVAPQLTVLVYEAGNSLIGLEQIYGKIVSDNRAPVSSSSWGQCENYFDPGELDTLHSILTQGGAQGLQFFSASGDSGAFDCNTTSNEFPQRTVDYPASDPNVIGVGGTTLQLDGQGGYVNETVWANAGDKQRAATGAGSGGGLSSLWSRPTWQEGPGVQNQYSNGKRQVPDVAANSDPRSGYAVYCTVAPSCSASRPWVQVGGTSAAAPLWAAAAILVNQYNNGRVVSGPKLYELASTPQQYPTYHDIVSGNNLYYPATPGYDLSTGLGSVDFFNLARNLANTAATPVGPVPVLAPSPNGFADVAFANLWNRTDKQVAEGAAARTWLWGQGPLTSTTESYAESLGGKRQVQYFDKSRMEISNPNGDKNNQYYVTNGLLAKELISGQVQVGNNSFQRKNPANIGVAGDPDDKIGVTYANMNRYLNNDPNPLGVVIYATLNRFGDLGQNPYFGQYSVTSVTLVKETNHSIAKPFWDYLNSQGPIIGADGRPTTGLLFNPTFYATGLPITEPYWTQVKVAGQVKDVLVQAFERRVLTYTPSNAPEWRVEQGNVGQHYYRWRYQN